jgi:hypothetical protein
MSPDWISVLLMIAALLTGGRPGASAPTNIPTSPAPAAAASLPSATPEDAVTAYLDGVARQDINQILGASAIEEPAANFDFRRYVDRLQAMPLMVSPAPASDPFLIAINQARRENEILSSVRNLAYSLLTGETIDGSMIANPEPQRVDAFVTALDTSRLAGIELVQIGAPLPDLLNSERFQANAAEQARIYGADELTERLALFTFEGQPYVAGFTLLRYGTDWKVMSQVSNLAGTSALGTVQATTVAQFEDLIRSDN